ncbi:sel1 repeat family protein [Burkholderia pseudomallei]|nr:sel1 repeat family protein [Burkholderia pseudomallei]
MLASSLPLWPAACARNPSAGGMVRRCDDRGCADRPENQASYALRNSGADQENPRLAALEARAKTEPKAAYDLGPRYFRGDGVRRDSDRARRRPSAATCRRGGRSAVLPVRPRAEMGSDAREADKWLSIVAGRGENESKERFEQARADKRVREEDDKRRTQWRDVYDGYWHSGYPYLGVRRQSDGCWY